MERERRRASVHPVAVGLVLLSAITHVAWNYLVKRSPAPAIYAWWVMAIGAALLAPLAVWRAWPVWVPPAAWACVAATGLLYAGYFTLIARSYDREDLSRAYPIARGVAPLATAVWGVLFYREAPSLGGWLGIGGVSLGVLALAQPAVQRGKGLPASGVLAAVGVGLCTSGYSAVDKAGVRLVDPMLYIVLTFAAGAVAQGIVLWPRHNWRAFAEEARRGRAGLPAAAAFSIGGYLLVLEVLRTAPVSYVVPLRSFSVLLSVFAGARLLGEQEGLRRLAAAALIVLGISAIALAG
jgi:drug/metabolite transporter (DMT)-like permease